MTGEVRKRVVYGFLLVGLGATCDVMGVHIHMNPHARQWSFAGIFWVLFGLVVFITPGVMFLVGALRRSRRDARLSTLMGLARACERLPLAQIAAELKVSPTSARELLLEAIALRLIQGRIDLEDGVFISASAHAIQKTATACRHCGGVSAAIPSMSKASTCQYCGFQPS